MGKVGICTLFNKNRNYGAVLQAYALCRIVNSFGHKPETMKMSDILYVYERSESDKVEDNITSLALRYGLNVVGVPSTAKNLKITTADDFLIIKALLKAEM